jgi:hypothetical protein
MRLLVPIPYLAPSHLLAVVVVVDMTDKPEAMAVLAAAAVCEKARLGQTLLVDRVTFHL